MFSSVRYLLFCGLITALISPVRAQNAITTNGLPTPSACAGAVINVPFFATGTYTSTNAFRVQLQGSSGGFFDIPSGTTAYNSSTRVYTTQATIPPAQGAGVYNVRIASSSPAVAGSGVSLIVGGKPAVPAGGGLLSYCQGQTAQPLSVQGVNLKWYDDNGAIPGAPTPNTNQVGTKNYAVSQSVNGCESDVARFAITVNAGPGPPTTAGTIGLCQNAPTGPLTANGQQLTWYDAPAGGTNFGGSVTPATNTPGDKTYYVSQTLNGCESSRASLTVNVRSKPGPPSTNATVGYCQGNNAPPLTAQGDNLKWYNDNGSIGGPPTPATNTPGNTNYAVTQTVDGCESDVARIVVSVRGTPGPPAVQAVGACQNGAAPTLSAAVSGQNLLWYAAESGGAGSGDAPTVSTAQPGQQTYYVSQKTDGCESFRAKLTVTIGILPGPPTVATGPTYCQNSPASPLTAQGENLRWYRDASGGNGQASLTPETNTVGTATYYVSQVSSGCEGSRAGIQVTTSAKSPAPTAQTSFSYCQQTTASVLTATGTALRWYDGNGTVLANAPTPDTNAPGTVQYAVSQTTNGCESDRTTITVLVLTTLTAPDALTVSVCLNAISPTLTASGSNLLWYSASTGGTGSASAPAINTGQVGTQTVYVSQRIGTCESPRSALSVVIKPLPTAPVATPLTVCQFSTPMPVSATGQTVQWYNAADGTRFPTAPVPPTDRPGVVQFQVTQTVDGCESPRAVLLVTVQNTPAPTVPRPTVELCQGATAQPLEAIGTALRWFDSGGNFLANAPTPATNAPTSQADGLPYYVTQTGANGCESPRATIRVFVQTVPTGSVMGSTTINFGQETALRLVFTGTGPYQFRLSTGLSGTATKDTTVLVLPTRTTTYQMAEVANRCGRFISSVGASAVVTVNVPTITTLPLAGTLLCAGQSIGVGFQTTGVFNAGSVFKIQISRAETDTSKIRYVDLDGVVVAGNQAVGTIPVSLTAGTYLLRAIATNPRIPVLGSPSPTLLSIRPRPTAVLTDSQDVFAGSSAKLAVAFTGDGPWTFTYADTTGQTVVRKTVTTSNNPHSEDVKPDRTITYRLSSVESGCGFGTVSGQATVKVNPVLATEPGADWVTVYPNPAREFITVSLAKSASEPTRLILTDITGKTIWQRTSRDQKITVPVVNQAVGLYYLRVQAGNDTATFRVMTIH